jgi:recombinational DNA repair ATPase RecF
VPAWDVDLVRLGASIHEARALYVDQLVPMAIDIAQCLLGLRLSMSYRSGWSRELSLGEALKASWIHDQDAGVTQVGPHRY